MDRNPWASYWAGGAGSKGGCLPSGAAGVHDVLDGVWRECARAMPPRARILDLATGDGAVLRRIKAARSGLSLMGIDFAPALPPSPPGIALKANVAMDALPFGNDRFDAVTSQFGIEYGDTARIAPEVARVLKPGGRIVFVIHHRESAVVEHNLARRSALSWAAQESGTLATAQRFANAQALAPMPIPPAFAAAVAEARRLHPSMPVAAEFLAAVLQALEMGRGRPPAEALSRLELLKARAADEIGRIDALDRAACDDERAAAIVRHVKAGGIATSPLEALTEPSGRSLAWLLRGRAG